MASPAAVQGEGRGPQEGQKNEVDDEMTLSAMSTHRQGMLTCSFWSCMISCSKTRGEIVCEWHVCTNFFWRKVWGASLPLSDTAHCPSQCSYFLAFVPYFHLLEFLAVRLEGSNCIHRTQFLWPPSTLCHCLNRTGDYADFLIYPHSKYSHNLVNERSFFVTAEYFVVPPTFLLVARSISRYSAQRGPLHLHGLCGIFSYRPVEMGNPDSGVETHLYHGHQTRN